MTRHLPLLLLLVASPALSAEPEPPPAPAPETTAARPAAVAPLGASQVMEKIEQLLNGYADQTMEIHLTVVDIDDSRKAIDFTLHQKGNTRRLIQFTSGESKGLATLVEDRSTVYVWLPGYKKVRRIAPHSMNQTLAGSDLSNNDMANTSWTRDWDARLEKEDAECWWIATTPKAREGAEYAKVVHRVDKKTFLQREVHYFDQAGVEVKRFENKNEKDFGPGARRASLIIVSDPRTGHRTEMEVRAFRVNQGLKDDLFTVRSLQWGK